MSVMQRNAQLSARERCCVYISSTTFRILGFGHESMKPQLSGGFTTEVLYHASDIERYAERYRQEQIQEQDEKNWEMMEREAPARNAIKAALRARKNHVDADNRAYIDANLKLMEAREEANRKRKEAVMYLVSEKFEEGVKPEDIALDNPRITLT